MNNIITAVTPITTGLIWLPKKGLNTKDPSYLAIDYLLDGLLTASLNVSHDFTSKVMVGKNYNQSLYVIIINDLIPAELESFLNLIKNELKDENDILVVDEKESFSHLQKSSPKDIHARYRLL